MTAPAGADLEALLTPVRARLLRLLDRERSMSQLAVLLYAAPPTVTYQVSALVAAGLAGRRRDGRRILVSRTERGDALLGLYRHGPAGPCRDRPDGRPLSA